MLGYVSFEILFKIISFHNTIDTNEIARLYYFSSIYTNEF